MDEARRLKQMQSIFPLALQSCKYQCLLYFWCFLRWNQQGLNLLVFTVCCALICSKHCVRISVLLVLPEHQKNKNTANIQHFGLHGMRVKHQCFLKVTQKNIKTAAGSASPGPGEANASSSMILKMRISLMYVCIYIYNYIGR